MDNQSMTAAPEIKAVPDTIADAFDGFMGAFEALTKHSDVTSYFTYEYGLGFALVVPLLSLPFWKAGQRLARAPFASAPASVSY